MSEDKNTIVIHGREYVAVDSLKSGPDVDVDGLKYVIVRSRYDGVKCGYLAGYEGQVVRLKLARQIWIYDSTFVLIDLAEDGPRDASKCKFSKEATADETTMLEACGIIPCTAKGGAALRSVKAQCRS